MRIQLTDKYVLTSNNENLILNEVIIPKSGKKKGIPYIAAIAWFGRLQQLVRWLVDHEIKHSDAMAFIDLHDEITRHCESLKGTSDIIDKKWAEKHRN